MSGLVVLLPALLLAGGATLCATEGRRPPRARTWPVLLTTASAAVVALALAAWVLAHRGQDLSLSLPAWFEAIPGSGIGLSVDALAAVCLVLIAGSSLVVSLRLLDRISQATALAAPLAVAAAAAVFVVAGRVPLGLVLAWLLLDGALALAGAGRRGLLTGQAGLLCVLMGLLALPTVALALDAPEVLAAGAERVERLQGWLVLGAAVRMGVYPMWWAVPRTDRRSPWLGGLTRLAPIVAGGYLALRAMQLSRPAEALASGALLPLAVVLVAGAVLAWLAREPIESLDWRLVTQATLVLLALRPGGPAFRGLGLVLLVNLVLCGLVLFLTADLPRRRPVTLVRRLADASLVGLPLTLGFQGRWPLYGELALAAPLVLALVVVGTTLAARPRSIGGPPLIPALGDLWAVELAAVALAVVLAVGGLLPFVWSPLQAAVVGLPAEPALMGLVAELGRPEGRALSLLLVLLLLAPPVVGELLRRLPGSADPAMRSRRTSARRLLRLTELADAAARAVVWAGGALQGATGLAEGRRARMWTLVAVVVIAVMALNPPIEPGGPAAAVPWPATALLLAAGAVAAVMLLTRRADATLGALAAGYALLVGALVVSGVPAVVAAIKLVAGALVVAMLALAVAEMPIDRHVARRAHRLRTLGRAELGVPARPVLALALATALVTVLGIHAVSLPLEVPDTVLHPALALVAGGVLTAVTARSPLRLVSGVLLALVGFEMAYARLDPGLLIAAGLAMFELLLAVVASYFLGLAAHPDQVG
jgi:hypothetical protein